MFPPGIHGIVATIEIMQEIEITDFILDGLNKSHSRDDILMGVCRNTGIPWGEAEAFLQRIEEENEVTITRHQFPLMVVVALIFFITGIFLTGYGGYGIYLTFTPHGGLPNDLTTYFMPIIRVGLDPFHALKAVIPAYFKFIVVFLFSPISATLLGIAMIVGSLMGMRTSWAAILHQN
jgi:hypothetical protein